MRVHTAFPYRSVHVTNLEIGIRREIHLMAEGF